VNAWRAGWVLAIAALFFDVGASARTLAEVKSRGAISLCANPDALPYASNRGEAPGFQIEIARALADALGVALEIDWIVPRMRASLVDCDMLLDTIVANDVARGPVKVSHAYQKSGVALAIKRGKNLPERFGDLPAGTRTGVMVNSVASMLLNQRGLSTVPYSFEADMIADLAKSELDAAAVSPAAIAYYIRLHPESGLRYAHAYDTEPELAWSVAVGLRRSDDALVDAINAALDRMIDTGTLAKVYAKYGVDYRRP
jgi:polar amino acid transport system substrate-binding protein